MAKPRWQDTERLMADSAGMKTIRRMKKARSHGLLNKRSLERSLRAREVNKIFRIKTMSDKQRIAISLLSDFQHNWPMEYIADKCGVALSALRRWRNDPFFLRELDKELTRRLTAVRLEAIRHLNRKVRKGEWKVIRDYFKMTGDLKERVEVTEGPEDLPEEQLDQEIVKLSDELNISIEQES